MRKFLIISLAVAILFLMIGVVAADDTITIEVGCKHIIGADGYSEPLFLISTVECNGYYREISADYRVSPEDYYKVNVGDTVTLKVKDNKLGLCEIITSENNNDGWW